MQMARHTLSATARASRSSMVAKPSASQTFISFDALLERTMSDMYSSSLPGPEEIRVLDGGAEKRSGLTAKHEPSYPLRPATGTYATGRCRSAGLSNVQSSRRMLSLESFKNQTRDFAHMVNSLTVRRARNIGTLEGCREKLRT